MDFLKIATRYAGKGFAVFPLRGKFPAISKDDGGNGCSDATTDAATIEAWAVNHPSANVGIATGLSNLVVLDVDVKHNGLESYEELCAFIPDIRKGWMVKTGTGGIHVYFRYTYEGNDDIANSASKLAPGLDIRGRGGYVVAPPSVHPDTQKKYEWTQHDGEMPDLPAALKQRLVDLAANRTPTAIDPSKPITEARNSTLTSIAGRFRHMGIDPETLRVTLLSINQRQCNPPLDDDEVERIAKSVSRYDPAKQLADLKSYGQDRLERKGKKKLHITKYSAIRKEEFDWLWTGRIAYGKFTLIVGMPGKGKSYATCALAASVSQGLPMPDDPFAMGCTPKSVLMLTYEDGQGDTIKPRLEKCGADMDRIYTIEHDKPMFTIDDVPALEESLQENPDIKVVIIDPMQAIMAGADGNNDEAVRQKLQPFVNIGLKYGVALIGVKHLNKNENASIENRIGGSIGYAGIARTILLAGHDSTKEFEPGHTYGGIVAIKTNIASGTMPIAYEITNSGFQWLGPDPNMTTESLLPTKKKERD